MTSAKTRERAPLHLRGMLWFAVLFVWGFQATCFLWGEDRLIHLTKIGLVVHALFMTAACAHAHLQTKWDVFTQTLAIVTVDLSAFIQAGAFALVLFGPTDVGLIGESLDDYGDALTELGNFYEHGVPLGVALLTTAAVGAETRDGIGSSTHPLVTLGITLNGILIYSLYYDPTEVYKLQDEARPWLFLVAGSAALVLAECTRALFRL